MEGFLLVRCYSKCFPILTYLILTKIKWQIEKNIWCYYDCFQLHFWWSCKGKVHGDMISFGETWPSIEGGGGWGRAPLWTKGRRVAKGCPLAVRQGVHQVVGKCPKPVVGGTGELLAVSQGVKKNSHLLEVYSLLHSKVSAVWNAVLGLFSYLVSGCWPGAPKLGIQRWRVSAAQGGRLKPRYPMVWQQHGVSRVRCSDGGNLWWWRGALVTAEASLELPETLLGRKGTSHWTLPKALGLGSVCCTQESFLSYTLTPSCMLPAVKIFGLSLAALSAEHCCYCNIPPWGFIFQPWLHVI